jgi:ketosteroid isomerase-like protein
MTKHELRSRDPLAVVQAMYAAFGAGDEGTLRELIDPDVSWRQCEGFPGGEHRRGIESVLAGVLRGNRATWRGFAAPIERYVASGDDVIALGHYEGVHAETQKAMHAVFAHVYRVRSGRIVTFEQFADTWPMVRAMQP